MKMKTFWIIVTLLMCGGFGSTAWADCYILHLGMGERVHTCEYGPDSGYEYGFGNGDGVLLRDDGGIDDILGTGGGAALILRQDGRIEELVALDYGDGIIVDQYFLIERIVGSDDTRAWLTDQGE